MKQFVSAIVLGAGLALAMPLNAAIRDAVRVENGWVSGVPGRDAAITVFKGIPYAAPPTGALRWRPPQPPLRWQGVRKADQFGAGCPQVYFSAATARPIDEDCLNLDVWTAAATATEKRPVMVWLHGAGWAGSDPMFDGETLARKGAVVVTINYRVGALGFLATPELSKESEHNSSGNYGLLDDIAALRWVHDNIQSFGGDPEQVTVFGESFGAGSINFLLMSPLAKGLFQRAIIESHVRYPRDPELFRTATRYLPKATAEATGARFVQSLGVNSLSELRAMPWQKIAAASDTSSRVIDGWVLPLNYSETFARGAQNDVVVLAGSNRDESGGNPATAFDLLTAGRTQGGGGPGPIITLAEYQRVVRQKFGAMAEEFLKFYPASNDREAFLAYGQSMRDNHRLSSWHWAQSWKQKATQPVYLYIFAHAPPGADHDLVGAYHGAEVSYVFGHLYPTTNPWADKDRRLADTLSSYWVNFAKSGNPNGPGLPMWQPFDPKVETIMEIGDGFKPIPLAEPAKLDFWRRFYATQPES